MHRAGRLALVLTAACALAAIAGDAATGAPPPPLPISTSSIVVRAGSPADFDAVERYAAARGYRVQRRAPDVSALQLELPGGEGLPRAIATFSQAPGVIYVEPIYRAFAADVPADPLYSRERRYLEPVKAPEAWDVERGRPEVIVAILDTGVDVSHPDLQGRIWSNPNEVAGNGVDDDANGCVDDVNGCAFVTFPEPGCRQALGGDVADDIGHGTFVSGIVAANGDDAGMVGVARGATVLPVKVLDCEGSGNSLELAQGIFYAAKNGARILNVSLGGPTDPLIVREAVRVAAEEYGALVVAASGNSGGEGVAYPARYPQALAVGAASVADPGARASFSTAGPEVDVVAIGEGIIGTVPPEMCGIFAECIGGHHAAGDGTSFAAPQVAGLVALLLSRRPSLTPQAIVDHLKATADPVREPGNWAGAGRVNMLETVQPPFRLGVPGTARD